MTGRPISPMIRRNYRDPRQFVAPDGSVHALVEVVKADDNVQLHLNVASSDRERFRAAADARGLSMSAMFSVLVDTLPSST